MLVHRRVLVLIIGVECIVILSYLSYKHVYSVNSAVENSILEVDSWLKFLNATINDIHYQNQSGIDSELLELENQVFSSANSGPTTKPVNTQLLYADYVKLVKNYIISKSDYCVKYPKVETMIFVWSRVNGSAQRNAIRQTWANQTYTGDSSVKLLFVLGSTNNKTHMNRVLAEDRLYDDILQFELMDSYHNCTLKSIGVLRWTHFFCKNIRYLMKTDDDIVVNTKNLERFVRSDHYTPLTIYGILAKQWGVIRDNQSKWFISGDIYSEDRFPDFIVAAHLMTRDCVSVLYAKCLKTLPAFSLEDVYITGILANGTAMQRKNLSKFVKLEWSKKPWLSSDLFDRSICIGHSISGRTLLKFWSQYSKQHVWTV